MSARQFGRDSGDTYGRHALREPGGDNRQRDVLHVIDLGALYADGWRLHPQRIDADYIGRHRAVTPCESLIRWAHLEPLRASDMGARHFVWWCRKC
jgi:hypothetical protein